MQLVLLLVAVGLIIKPGPGGTVVSSAMPTLPASCVRVGGQSGECYASNTGPPQKPCGGLLLVFEGANPDGTTAQTRARGGGGGEILPNQGM